MKSGFVGVGHNGFVMSQKCLCLVAFLLILSASVFGVNSEETYSVGLLDNCRNLYVYNGNANAYVYGSATDTLYSSRVLPDVTTKYVTVSGVIRSVCHDEASAYALVEQSRKNYCVVQMNMNSGNCNYYDIGTQKNIYNLTFAVSDDEIFIICTDSANSYVKSYNKSGDMLYNYGFNNENVEALFVNGSRAYAKLYGGDIYLIGGNSKSFCASVKSGEELSNAGVGYVFTSGKRLFNLSDNSSTYIADASLNQVVANGDVLYVDGDTVKNLSGGSKAQKSAELLLSAGDEVSAVTADFECVNFDIPTADKSPKVIAGKSSQVQTDNKKAQKIDNASDSGGNDYWIDNGIFCGVESQTTVAMLKNSFSQAVTVYDSNGNEVNSGKLKTGYVLRYSGDDYPIAVRGDVTGEGNVNTKDIKLLMDVLAGLKKLSNEFHTAADYNLDGNVDTRDLVLIAQKYEADK